MGKEIELKLEVPPQELRRLKGWRALSLNGAVEQDLASGYFDTPKHKLGRSGILLRIRRNGKKRLQTIKSQAGRLRIPLRPHSRDEAEFRDGIHLVWGIAVLIGALAAVAVSSAVSSGRPTDVKSSTASTAEPLFALELDQLFRSDRKPTDPGDQELRAQAARIISSGLGHRTMAPEDRAYLVRLVEARTGIAATEADGRVTQTVNKSRDAVSKARGSAVILAFMVAASLLVGAAVAWLAAAAGGQHRDGGIVLHFWRRWEVDRSFMIR
jgi:hypothetical protein